MFKLETRTTKIMKTNDEIEAIKLGAALSECKIPYKFTAENNEYCIIFSEETYDNLMKVIKEFQSNLFIILARTLLKPKYEHYYGTGNNKKCLRGLNCK